MVEFVLVILALLVFSETRNLGFAIIGIWLFYLVII